MVLVWPCTSSWLFNPNRNWYVAMCSLISRVVGHDVTIELHFLGRNPGRKSPEKFICLVALHVVL